MELHILFEDPDILVCEKPPGLPVQSARTGVMDMESLIRNYLAKVQGTGSAKAPYLGLVHRLDQPVQGVMVFAKTRDSAGKLCAQAADGRMKKIYHALVLGTPPAGEGLLTDWLVKDGRTNRSRVAAPGTKDAKEARLRYRILKQRPGLALAEIELLTGRHHQIRVQMAHANMPLAGDRKYGPLPDDTGLQAPQDAPPGSLASRQTPRPFVALCAVRLTFFHPKTGEPMTFSCTPDFEKEV